MDTRSQHLLLDGILKKPITPDVIEHLKYIIEKNLTVVSRIEHHFEPQGETIAFILSESHFTLHTYPEHNYLSMDIYVCNLETNLEKIVNEIKEKLDFEKLDQKIIFL